MDAIKRAEYMSKMTRNQVSTIIKARTRMLKVKMNYKNGYTEHNCRLCGKDDESQTHILENCEKLTTITPAITQEMIFNENTDELLELVKIYKKEWISLKIHHEKHISVSHRLLCHQRKCTLID